MASMFALPAVGDTMVEAVIDECAHLADRIGCEETQADRLAGTGLPGLEDVG